eukprot:CAMPEP_0114491520 /NCGR_PEP_ID=MMETSP0109-20121206/3048_1 /TAXON_ID=29199 /ORGANISM="Chlorarachnion reptans, Strain CCCM449" /LENGTH=115 /DNA_ID=CAMNT_0001668267 /DNA_START=443 /DNA_END=790 /DNA_ORIENTATION=+
MSVGRALCPASPPALMLNRQDTPANLGSVEVPHRLLRLASVPQLHERVVPPQPDAFHIIAVEKGSNRRLRAPLWKAAYEQNFISGGRLGVSEGEEGKQSEHECENGGRGGSAAPL